MREKKADYFRLYAFSQLLWSFWDISNEIHNRNIILCIFSNSLSSKIWMVQLRKAINLYCAGYVFVAWPRSQRSTRLPSWDQRYLSSCRQTLSAQEVEGHQFTVLEERKISWVQFLSSCIKKTILNFSVHFPNKVSLPSVSSGSYSLCPVIAFLQPGTKYQPQNRR